MKKILVLVLIISSYATAQTVDELFVEANSYYQKEQYKQAIATYEKIEKREKVSSELFFNLGNCYYKLNQVAPTIYNYEMALLLNPFNKEASINLAFAKRLTIDTIKELPKTFLQKINTNSIQKFSVDNWAWFMIGWGFLGSTFFLMFYFSNTSAFKRSFFILSILSFLFFIGSSFITIHQYQKDIYTIEAIVFKEKIIVKNAPTKNSDTLFILHEGTKVTILDRVDDWNKIKIADGKIGWTLSKNIKHLVFK